MLYLDLDGKKYPLGNPISCSRKIITKMSSISQAFGLPEIKVEPVRLDNFIGDVDQGGSCNVNVISFTPHNLTHIETPAHVVKGGINLTDLDPNHLQGICLFLDLSSAEFSDNFIYPEHLDVLDQYPQSTILAIKTKYSNLPPDYDFTGTDPISLHPSTATLLTKKYPTIKLIVLDLPSADKEDDGGKLLSHRNYFGLDQTSLGLKKAIIELAHFPDLMETSYVYLMTTPARIDVDAIISDVVIYNIL